MLSCRIKSCSKDLTRVAYIPKTPQSAHISGLYKPGSRRIPVSSIIGASKPLVRGIFDARNSQQNSFLPPRKHSRSAVVLTDCMRAPFCADLFTTPTAFWLSCKSASERCRLTSCVVPKDSCAGLFSADIIVAFAIVETGSESQDRREIESSGRLKVSRCRFVFVNRLSRS